MSGVAYSVRNL